MPLHPQTLQATPSELWPAARSKREERSAVTSLPFWESGMIFALDQPHTTKPLWIALCTTYLDSTCKTHIILSTASVFYNNPF
jgi:hypothetical protein